jgi:hypothetical protein
METETKEIKTDEKYSEEIPDSPEKIKTDEKYLKKILDFFENDDNYYNCWPPATTENGKKNKININSKNDILDLLQRTNLSLKEKLCSYPKHSSNSLLKSILLCFTNDQMKNIIKPIFAALNDEKTAMLLEKAGIWDELHDKKLNTFSPSLLEVLTYLKESTVMCIFFRRDAKTKKMLFLDLFVRISNPLSLRHLKNLFLTVIDNLSESNINMVFKLLNTNNYDMVRKLPAFEIDYKIMHSIMSKLHTCNLFSQLFICDCHLPTINNLIGDMSIDNTYAHKILIPTWNLIVERFDHENSETKTREMAAALQKTVVDFLIKNKDGKIMHSIMVTYIEQFDEKKQTTWEESDERNNLIKLLKWLNYVPKKSQHSKNQRPINLILNRQYPIEVHDEFHYSIYSDIFTEINVPIDRIKKDFS